MHVTRCTFMLTFGMHLDRMSSVWMKIFSNYSGYGEKKKKRRKKALRLQTVAWNQITSY